MKRSLSWSMRFALVISVVFVTGAVLAGTVAYILQAKELSTRLETDVEAMAQGLAKTTDPEDLREQITAHLSTTDHSELLLAYRDNATETTFGNVGDIAPFVGAARLKAADILVSDPKTDQSPEGYYAFGIRTADGWLMVAKDDAWVVETGELMMRTSAWSFAFALLMTVLFALLIARRNEKRIAGIEAVLTAVGAGDHKQRVAVSGTDDLARLSDGINRTFDQIEAGIDAIRQMSTDVAHDLRAPLARLRIKLEHQALDASLPDSVKQDMGSALVELDGIADTFDAILRLSRLQSGAISPSFTDVDLAAIGQEVQDILSAVAEDAGHVLSFENSEGCHVLADPHLLTQALVNMVDNAIRHCPEPATITIYAAGNTIGVRDNGPGIPEAMRERVLQRFVRLDQSRHTAGSGIGLSLVAAIANIHNATLKIADAAPGLDIAIEFTIK